MSFNRKVNVGVLVEELSVGLNRGLLIGAKVRLVVVEINIFDVLAKEILFRRPGLRRRRYWSGWRGDGEARGSVLGATAAFGCEVIGSGIGGIDLLRSAGLNRADAVNGDVGSIGSLPAEGCGLSLLNG